MHICSVDRVRTIQCSMYAVDSSEVSAPVAPKVKLILQNIPNKVVHCNIHTEFSSD